MVHFPLQWPVHRVSLWSHWNPSHPSTHWLRVRQGFPAIIRWRRRKRWCKSRGSRNILMAPRSRSSLPISWMAIRVGYTTGFWAAGAVSTCVGLQEILNQKHFCSLLLFCVSLINNKKCTFSFCVSEFGHYAGRVRFESSSPMENSALLISSTEVSDEGRYTCHISTFPNGNFERCITLSVWSMFSLPFQPPPSHLF